MLGPAAEPTFNNTVEPRVELPVLKLIVESRMVTPSVPS
jgi:hypothetical protein